MPTAIVGGGIAASVPRAAAAVAFHAIRPAESAGSQACEPARVSSVWLGRAGRPAPVVVARTHAPATRAQTVRFDVADAPNHLLLSFMRLLLEVAVTPRD